LQNDIHPGKDFRDGYKTMQLRKKTKLFHTIKWHDKKNRTDSKPWIASTCCLYVDPESFSVLQNINTKGLLGSIKYRFILLILYQSKIKLNGPAKIPKVQERPPFCDGASRFL